ncbi:hypothetical protein GJ744_006018 [Endocarpon pusillum]|uniref:Uncharacterized protein n=1 Tax=Endocarpon pusillum TaxID=364733 RepID=A0A8H7DYF9_9EURO|nr:hypothetical protein GJ744_006018 [Endocarpon pusillum]
MAEQHSINEVVASQLRSNSTPEPSLPPSPFASTEEATARLALEQDEAQVEHIDRPATPASARDAVVADEHQSPVPSTNFSAAATLLTRDSHYTVNTGGRAEQSWRGGIANIWHPPSTFLSNDPSESGSSVVGEESTTSSLRDVPRVETPPIEISAAPVTGPDEPRSFFDSDSDSDGETILRTATRASSLRGQRPKLVEHNSSNVSVGRTRFYQSARLAPPRNPGPSHSKAEQILGIKLKNLLDLTPAGESPNPLASANTATLNALTANEVAKASTTALAPSTPATPASLDPSSVREVPNTPTRVEALDTLPSPWGGFGTLRLSGQNADRIGVSPLDALRSNPVTRIDTVGLRRSTSAPPLPYRGNRKVAIRPVDMEIIHTAHQKKLFRESVVSTPYPTRHQSIAMADVVRMPTIPRKGSNTLAPKTEKDSIQPPTVAQVSPPEILILELSLARQPLSTKMITIPIYDRSTFDDCALFSILRNSYHHTILGFTLRFLTARTLSYASFIFPSSPSTTGPAIPFDAADFLKHLQHPKSGHRRKTWLQWLRKHPPRSTANNNNLGPSSRDLTARSGSIATAASPATYFSSEGIPRTPAFIDPRSLLLFLFLLHHHHHHHHHHRSNPTSPSNANANANPNSSSISAPSFMSSSQPVATTNPVIILHHSFSLLRIAAAISLVLALTVLATILWVLFGTPGVSAADAHARELLKSGNGSGMGSGVPNGDAAGMGSGIGVENGGMGGGGGVSALTGKATDWDWRVSAQNRVLTGLLMGVLVLLMGMTGVLGWVGGSWAAL